MKKLNYYLVILFGLLLLACRTDENEDSKVTNQYQPINAFVNFEKQINSQKSSGINYAYPFAEIISNFLDKTPGFRKDFEKEYGEIDLSLASQTFGENNKYNIFPIIKKGHVSSLLICEINTDRTYARFKVLDSKTPKLNIKEIIDSFETKFSTKSNRINATAREVAIEEVIITVYYNYYIYWSSGSSGSGTSGGGNMNGDGTIHGSGGSGGSDSATMAPPPPDVPISDMQKFLSCFDRTKSANLKIYAQRMFGGNGVGHAFISITQGNNTMTFGFYPKYGMLNSLIGPGVFGEDGGHPYTSYKSFGSMSPTEFNNVLNVISSYANSNYDLTGHNCSDFALDILRSIGFVGIDTSGVDNPNTVADYIAKFSDVVNVAGNGPQTQRTCK